MAPVIDALRDDAGWGARRRAPDPRGCARSGTPTGVIAARTADGEARAVTAEVLAALTAGTPPERIALVVPDLEETRLEPLRAALGDARVPFAEPRGRPVASCPEGRIALRLLLVAAGQPGPRPGDPGFSAPPGLHPGAWMDHKSAPDRRGRAVVLAHRLRGVPVGIDRTGRLLIDALTDVTRARPDERWMPRALDRILREARWVAADGSAAATAASPRAASSPCSTGSSSAALPSASSAPRSSEGRSPGASRRRPGQEQRRSPGRPRPAGEGDRPPPPSRSAPSARAPPPWARSAGRCAPWSTAPPPARPLADPPVSPAELAYEQGSGPSSELGIGPGHGRRGRRGHHPARPADLAGARSATS